MLPKPAVGSPSSVVALACVTQAQRHPSSFVQKENLKLKMSLTPLLSVHAHTRPQAAHQGGTPQAPPAPRSAAHQHQPGEQP